MKLTGENRYCYFTWRSNETLLRLDANFEYSVDLKTTVVLSTLRQLHIRTENIFYWQIYKKILFCESDMINSLLKFKEMKWTIKFIRKNDIHINRFIEVHNYFLEQSSTWLILNQVRWYAVHCHRNRCKTFVSSLQYIYVKIRDNSK